jgi:hypothetical protein
VLTAYGNVPPERAAQLMGMLPGAGVSAGWVDKAGSRLSALLGTAGLDEAMIAALAGEMVLAADETPVNVIGRGAPQLAAPEDGKDERDPEEKDGKAAGAPHVLIVRTPDRRLTWLQAIASRRKADVAAGIPAAFARVADHRRIQLAQIVRGGRGQFGVPGPGSPTIGGFRARHITLAAAQDPEVQRGCRSVLGMPGIDRILPRSPRGFEVSPFSSELTRLAAAAGAHSRCPESMAI